VGDLSGPIGAGAAVLTLIVVIWLQYRNERRDQARDRENNRLADERQAAAEARALAAQHLAHDGPIREYMGVASTLVRIFEGMIDAGRKLEPEQEYKLDGPSFAVLQVLKRFQQIHEDPSFDADDREAIQELRDLCNHERFQRLVWSGAYWNGQAANYKTRAEKVGYRLQGQLRGPRSKPLVIEGTNDQIT
jgi:hypothetical protein